MTLSNRAARAACGPSIAVVVALALMLPAPRARAHCPAANPDLAQCPCEVTGAPWPTGVYQDEVIDAARNSLVAVTSCLKDGGQPYWQIQLHIGFPADAHTAAELDPNISTDFPRQAWCTETIAFWHYAALMPFIGGYGNPDWHQSSFVRGVMEMRTWYRTEEELRAQGRGGRGRWIGGSELDYANFQPGVNGPCPGAYQALEAFDAVANQWADSCYHSQLVDSMVIWRWGDANGPVQAVDVHVIEGNAGAGKFLPVSGDSVSRGTVRNTMWYRNVIDFTRLGARNLGRGNRKIRGWGIDLHADGTTYCDEGRITTIVIPYILAYPAPIGPDEPDVYAVGTIVDYVLTRPGPIQVTTNASSVSTGGKFPDRTQHWIFPGGSPGVDSVYVQVDLRAEHPLPIRGVVVKWKGGNVPSSFQVRWAGATTPPLTKTFVPASGVLPTPTTQEVPIPVIFGPAPNYSVRYLRLVIPATALTRTFEVTEFDLLFDYGKEDGPADLYEPNVTTGVGENETGPDGLRMGAAVPNPFQYRTLVSFHLPTSSVVEVAIYDIAGRRVRSIGAIAGRPGTNELAWDGLDDAGHRVREGAYFVQVWAGTQRASRRIVLLR